MNISAKLQKVHTEQIHKTTTDNVIGLFSPQYKLLQYDVHS